MCQMHRLFEVYHTGGQRALSPKPLLSRIDCIGKHFTFGDQEDAHDFMVQLLDSIQEAFLDDHRREGSAGGAGAGARGEEGGEGGEGEGSKPAIAPRTQETTLVWQTFGGYSRGEVRCECGYVSRTFQGFLTLELQIPHGISSVEGALREFTKKESLTMDNKVSNFPFPFQQRMHSKDA